MNVKALSCKTLNTLLTYCVNVGILVEVTTGNKLNYITVVASCKSSVRGDNDNCLFVTVIISKVSMVYILSHRKDRTDGIIEHIKIWFIALCFSSGLLKLYCSNKLHRLGYLLSALDAFLTSLYVSH